MINNKINKVIQDLNDIADELFPIYNTQIVLWQDNDFRVEVVYTNITEENYWDGIQKCISYKDSIKEYSYSEVKIDFAVYDKIIYYYKTNDLKELRDNISNL